MSNDSKLTSLTNDYYKHAKFIPIAVHERSQARLERVNRRSSIIIVLLIVLLFATNGAWLYYESTYTDIEVTQDVQTDNSDNIVINGNGDLNYGN